MIRKFVGSVPDENQKVDVEYRDVYEVKCDHEERGSTRS